MFKFIKRQWKTKTGMSAILGIGGTIIAVASGAMPVLVGVGSAYGLIQTMLLRDKEAKKEEKGRNKKKE